MNDFTFAGYSLTSEFDVNGLQEHFDEFVVLVRLLGYKITPESEGPDVAFHFQSEKEFFSIVFERDFNTRKVFNVVFRGKSLKMAF